MNQKHGIQKSRQFHSFFEAGKQTEICVRTYVRSLKHFHWNPLFITSTSKCQKRSYVNAGKLNIAIMGMIHNFCVISIQWIEWGLQYSLKSQWHFSHYNAVHYVAFASDKKLKTSFAPYKVHFNWIVQTAVFKWLSFVCGNKFYGRDCGLNGLKLVVLIQATSFGSVLVWFGLDLGFDVVRLNDELIN